MHNLLDLPQHDKFPEIVWGIVEIPTGTSNKFEYDPRFGLLRLGRTLYSPVHYPYKELEGRAADTRGWVSLPETCETMYRARQRYQDRKQ